MTNNWRIEHYGSLASTSDTCAERARHGEEGGLLIVAAQQTAGRGRAGRSWASPPGNFYASALLRPNTPASQGGLFALLSGLALLEALESPLPTRSLLTLKWPNDVIAGTAKLAGILLDATIDSGTITTLIIGFGANLAFAPEIPGRPTTSLATLGLHITPDDLAPKLTDRLDHWLSASPKTLRTTWQAHAHPRGTTLAIDSGRITGQFEGIDADGSLLLRQGTQLAIIRSGDVAVL